MKYVYTLISLACLGTFLFYGHKSPIGNLPPVVDFMNPYTGWWQQAERPRLAKRLFTGPTQEDVTIIFDEQLIPHIYASNYEDAVYAQGILHAHFRLWQMDITQRGTVGRLAEIVGPKAVPKDEENRRMGMRALAHQLTAQARSDEWTRELLEKYSQGVNQVIGQLTPATYPLEFKLLQYQPEPWTLEHVGAIAASLTNSLCFRHEDDENTAIVNQFGKDFFQTYYPQWNPLQRPIIQKEYPSNTTSSSSERISEFSGDSPFNLPDPGNGSNNWAVHGNHTLSGNNMLANDPHLGLNLPSLWYEMHIHLPDHVMYGVSFPGIPGIVLGYNSHIAWGSTNVSHDVADWVNPIWNEKEAWTYLYEGEWLEAQVQREIIRVKGQDSIVIDIPITKLGRIPFPEADHKKSKAAFFWGPLESDIGNIFKTFMGFNLAEGYSDFQEALSHFNFPAQNFVFADRKDTVAMHIQGELPIRDGWSGLFILDSVNEKLYRQPIPFDDLPSEVNPERGFVSSANQHTTYPTYPHPYIGHFDDYRGRTLDSLLSEDRPMSWEQMKEIQLSKFSLEASEVLPLLLKYLDSSDIADSPMLDSLRNWNYVYEAESESATFFTMWWDHFKQITYRPLSDHKTPPSWVLTQLMKEAPTDTLFYLNEDSTQSGVKQIAFHSYEKARLDFDSLAEKKWYAFKGTHIPHLGNVDAFSSAILHNGGTSNALNSVKESHGPSWRMIIEMGSPIKAEGVYPGGQSGNPGSRFYDNFIEDWTEGNYHELKTPTQSEMNAKLTVWTIKSKS